ncbi:MAG: hypothetical protein ACK6D3_24355 [Planctomycetaceae bacterium]
MPTTERFGLSGSLSEMEARVVVVSVKIGTLAPVRRALAWAKTDSVPVILRQVNFCLEFDVCVLGSCAPLEVRSKPVAGSSANLSC